MTQIAVRSPSGSLPRLELFPMEDLFAEAALDRGAVHAVRGEVSGLAWDSGRAVLSGTVEDVAAAFSVLVQFTPVFRHGELEYQVSGSICTCAEGELCAHASGLLHALDLACSASGSTASIAGQSTGAAP